VWAVGGGYGLGGGCTNYCAPEVAAAAAAATAAPPSIGRRARTLNALGLDMCCCGLLYPPFCHLFCCTCPSDFPPTPTPAHLYLPLLLGLASRISFSASICDASSAQLTKLFPPSHPHGYLVQRLGCRACLIVYLLELPAELLTGALVQTIRVLNTLAADALV
jgi:hypothetical protein